MIRYGPSQIWRPKLASYAALVLSLILPGEYSLAQSELAPDIAPRRNLETRVVPLNSQVDQIRGGVRRGNTLFHSFSEFNIPENHSVYFENPLGVTNILSRVTGNSRSEILGTLGIGSPSAVGAANLFLINPNGILFGENARLDTRGSFLASTASSLQFDDWEFSAADPQPIPSLLSVNIPVGLQFGRSPGTITNQAGRIDGDAGKLDGGLRVRQGNALTLLGGNVNIDGGVLVAPGGQVELGGVVGLATVGLQVDGRHFYLNYPVEATRADVSSIGGSFISIPGVGGGSIVINSHNLDIEASCLSIGSGSCVLGDSNNPTGSIRFNSTGVITMTGGIVTTDGGSINIQARALSLIGTSRLTAESISQSSGDITIRATDSIRVSDGSDITASSLSSNNAGSIFITTNRLLINTVNGNTSRIFTEARGSGNAGRFEIHAADFVEVIGPDSQISASTGDESSGNGGNLIINTRRLIVRDRGGITTSTEGSGQAGELNINADIVQIQGDGSTLNSGADPNSSGNAGKLVIRARQVNVWDGALIQVRGRGTGAAGNLSITANSIDLDGGALTAETQAGSGANILLQVSGSLLMNNHGHISAQAFNSANGGNIVITADHIVAVPSENNDIIASAAAGNGGNILITASEISSLEVRRQTPTTNDIDASSEFGTSGTVEINSSDLGVTELPATPVTTQLSQACGNGDSSTSRFINSGRGGLPSSPYEPFSSSNILDDVRLPGEGVATENPTMQALATSEDLPNAIVEAQDWMVDETGRVVLLASLSDGRSPIFCHLH